MTKKTNRLNVSLIPSLENRLRAHASRNGQGVTEVARQLIIDYCDKQDLLRNTKK